MEGAIGHRKEERGPRNSRCATAHTSPRGVTRPRHLSSFLDFARFRLPSFRATGFGGLHFLCSRTFRARFLGLESSFCRSFMKRYAAISHPRAIHPAGILRENTRSVSTSVCNG